MSERTGANSTWMDVPDDAHFGIDTLPYGVFSTRDSDDAARVGVAVGSSVLDLAPIAAVEGLDGAHAFAQPSLDAFLALGRPAWDAVRGWVRELVHSESQRELVEPHLIPRSAVRMHAPFTVADYVDFYSSRDHATNVGRIFRPDSPELPAAWTHLPIGYHGRAGTVVPSGTGIVRPSGLRRVDGNVEFGPSLRLDIEVELGFVVGVPSELGTPVPTSAFQDHVFGVVVANDWSARDIQAFEYVPLGPFLGKSFATSISPWVVPLAALEDARIDPAPSPADDPARADYLRDDEKWGLDITFEVSWNRTVVARAPFAGMSWTPSQQLAHLTINGASVRTGDLYASGTVSGPERGQRGSFLELTWNGTDPVTLNDGTTRGFLEDGDTVTITATAPGPEGRRVGLGSVTGTVLPAR